MILCLGTRATRDVGAFFVFRLAILEITKDELL